MQQRNEYQHRHAMSLKDYRTPATGSARKLEEGKPSEETQYEDERKTKRKILIDIVVVVNKYTYPYICAISSTLILFLCISVG